MNTNRWEGWMAGKLQTTASVSTFASGGGRREDATEMQRGIGLMNADFVPRSATGIDSRAFVSAPGY